MIFTNNTQISKVMYVMLWLCDYYALDHMHAIFDCSMEF